MGLRDLLGDALTFGLSGAYKPTANPKLSFDKDGNPIDSVTGKALTPKDLQSPQYAPYTEPSIMARMFSPEAQQIDELNAQAEAGQNVQGRQASLQRQIAENTNINPLMSDLVKAGLPPNAEKIYAMTAGQSTDSRALNMLATGWRDFTSGLPAKQSATDLLKAGTGLGEAQAESTRQPIKAASDLYAQINQLVQNKDLDPVALKDEITKALGQYQREPEAQTQAGQEQKLTGMQLGGALQRAPIEQSSALAGSLAGNINAWNPTPEQFPFTQSPFRANLSLDNNQQPNVNFGVDESSFLPAMWNKYRAALSMGSGQPGTKSYTDPKTGQTYNLPSSGITGAKGLVGSPTNQVQTQLPPPQYGGVGGDWGVNPSDMRQPTGQGGGQPLVGQPLVGQGVNLPPQTLQAILAQKMYPWQHPGPFQQNQPFPMTGQY